MKNVIELFNNYQDDTAIFVLSIEIGRAHV